MDKIEFKKLWPYILTLGLFIALTLAYFNPLLEGKKMRQSDITQWKGMSKEIADYRASTGKEPLWTNSAFSGMPAYQISVIYKGNLVKYIDGFFQLYLPQPAGMVFLYLIGFYFLLLVLRVDKWVALGGAIAFAFSSYLFIIFEAGHNSKAHAIGYMAPVLASIIVTYRGKYLLGGALSALFLALELYTNHLQISYYLMLLILVFVISEFIFSVSERKIPAFVKASLVVMIAGFLAAGTSFSSLWTTYEYGKFTIRGKTELSSEKSNRTSGLDKDYATDYSYGIGETFTFLIPNAKGGSSSGSLSEKSASYKALVENGVPADQASEYIKHLPLYWGDQPIVAGPVYLGAVVLFLFFLGLFLVEKRYKWWILAASVLAILLAWGKNFMPLTDLFLHYFPGYNKFRAVTMILVIVELLVPLLAILGLNKIINSELKRASFLKALYYSFAVTAGLSLFLAFFGSGIYSFVAPSDEHYKSIFPEWLINALREDRGALLRADAYRSFLFILLAFGGLWLYINQKIRKQYLLPLIIVLLLIDSWVVNKRYVNNESFVRKGIEANPFQPSQADQIIMKDVDPNFRVYNQTVDPFNDASTSYFHKSLGGYHGAKLRRYQEIIEYHLMRGNMNVFNMLNTKYFIVPDKANNYQPIFQVNMEALGHAWYVNDIRLVKNADEEIEALNNFLPAETAIVDKRFSDFIKGKSISRDSASVISLKSYKPDELVYETVTTKEQLAVFSEIYYDKGWNAYIDGKLTPHFRADYILRAMVIPSGKHLVIFKFEPIAYKVGERISFGSSILLFLLLLASAGIQVNKLRKKTENDTGH